MRYRIGIILLMHMLSAVYASQPLPFNPVKPINFTRETNACYIASLLQALIALPSWRHYIMHYPPIGCTDPYDEKLLHGLQQLITGYTAAAPAGGLYPIEPFYQLLWDKEIVTHCEFGGVIYFLSDLIQALTKTNDSHCGEFNGPCWFLLQVAKKVGKDFDERLSIERQSLIDFESPLRYAVRSVSDSFALYAMNGSAIAIERQKVDKRRRLFQTTPQVLCMYFDVASNYFGQWSSSMTYSIPEILDITPWLVPHVQGKQPALYQLTSVIWQSPNHLIAYVNYNSTWYVCDDLRGEPSSVVKNAAQELSKGAIVNKYKYPLFLPTVLFYERVQGESNSAPQRDALQEMHTSLLLLSS